MTSYDKFYESMSEDNEKYEVMEQDPGPMPGNCNMTAWQQHDDSTKIFSFYVMFDKQNKEIKRLKIKTNINLMSCSRFKRFFKSRYVVQVKKFK